MVDILHSVSVKTPTPEKVYDAIATIPGLAGWWTNDTTGSTEVGGTIAFRFPPGGFDMEVVESVPGKRVLWKVADGPEEWVGTHVEWDLRQDGEWTTILFTHRGWAEPVEFMHHCSTKWGTYLLSLKELVETGTGRPSPDDVKVTSWD
ncbi:MAG: SRPBCC domain-containing protein [Nocardioidaceae bacterium]|nr:SRPBCC domain-containing protein [Nocardioidaceae bacterium]